MRFWEGSKSSNRELCTTFLVECTKISGKIFIHCALKIVPSSGPSTNGFHILSCDVKVWTFSQHSFNMSQSPRYSQKLIIWQENQNYVCPLVTAITSYDYHTVCDVADLNVIPMLCKCSCNVTLQRPCRACSVKFFFSASEKYSKVWIIPLHYDHKLIKLEILPVHGDFVVSWLCHRWFRGDSWSFKIVRSLASNF